MKSSTRKFYIILILVIVESNRINVNMLSKRFFHFLTPSIAKASIRSTSSTSVSSFDYSTSPIATPIHSNTNNLHIQTNTILFSITRSKEDLIPSKTTYEHPEPINNDNISSRQVIQISDSQIVSALKLWRKRTSDELQIPLYRVLTNNVIDLIANKRPRNLFEFRTLSGIGEAKMKKYGPRIVELVKAILSGRSELNLGPNIVLSPEDEKYLQEADAAAKLQKKKKAVTEKKILKTVKKLSKKGYCCLYVCMVDISIYW